MVNSVFIELTNACNCTCASCPQSVYLGPGFGGHVFDRKKGFMDFKLVQRLVKEAYEITNKINFSFFGEPMLHPQFLDILDLFKNRPNNKKLLLFTNFTCCTKEVMKKLIEIKINRIRISMDSNTSETYDKVRSGNWCLDLEGNKINSNRFNTMVDKITYWFSLCDHRPTAHEFVVSSQNFKELKGFIDRWQPLLGTNDIILTKTILSYGGIMLRDSFLNKYPCNMWDDRYIVVNWQGKVTPCFLDVNVDLSIGNVNEQPLKDIAYNKKYDEIRDLSKKRKIDPCKYCTDGNNRGKDFEFKKNTPWPEDLINLYKNL